MQCFVPWLSALVAAAEPPRGGFLKVARGISLNVHLARVESGASGERLGGLVRTRAANPDAA